MSGFDNLNKRLQYQGGNTEGRMRRDKLTGLQRSLFNSYQAETAILEDNRKFKCLINPNKETTDYDNKIISIPFKDICLNPEVSTQQKTSEGVEEIGLKVGDTFTWEETDTHWLVYLQYLEEDAYFRAQIRRCDQQITINDTSYWVYLRGPVETSITWNQKGGVEWNDLNYSLVMFITQNDETIDYFHRFTKVKITKPGTDTKQTWQVVGQNPYYGDGIIEVFLDEYFENTIEEAAEAENPVEPDPVIDKTKPYIEGPTTATVYDHIEFVATNFTERGRWYVTDHGYRHKMSEESMTLTIDVVKAGSIVIEYENDIESASMTVTVKDI